jgi:hypothetical protein
MKSQPVLMSIPPSKRRKFFDNLKIRRDLENQGHSDLEGLSGELEYNMMGTMNMAGDRGKKFSI